MSLLHQKMSRRCSCRQPRQWSSMLPRTWLPPWPLLAWAALQQPREGRQALGRRRQRRLSMPLWRRQWQQRRSRQRSLRL